MNTIDIAVSILILVLIFLSISTIGLLICEIIGFFLAKKNKKETIKRKYNSN
jgi:biopolymer transport protein ExbB/TolQ